MSDPEAAIAVTAPIGGRKRRLTTFKQLRTAITHYDIERDTEIHVEEEAGIAQTCRAGDHPMLRPLFDELLGPEPARIDPAVVAAAVADGTAKPAATVIPRTPDAPPRPTAPSQPTPVVAEVGGQQEWTVDPIGPPSKGFLPWVVGALVLLFVLWWLSSSSGKKEAEPIAAVSSAASDAAIAASEAATAAAAIAPTPDSSSEANPDNQAAERERQQKIAQEKSRERARLAAEREARRRGASTAVPTPVFIPEPPPRVSLTRKARPRGNWGSRIAASYPSRAMRDGIQGRVGVSVAIGSDGRVQSCSVNSSSGSPILDQAACDGMRRHAKFDPALDDDGNPTEGSYSTAIFYKLNE